jgi:hypothetical protein
MGNRTFETISAALFMLAGLVTGFTAIALAAEAFKMNHNAIALAVFLSAFCAILSAGAFYCAKACIKGE